MSKRKILQFYRKKIANGSEIYNEILDIYEYDLNSFPNMWKWKYFLSTDDIKPHFYLVLINKFYSHYPLDTIIIEDQRYSRYDLIPTRLFFKLIANVSSIVLNALADKNHIIN